MNSESGIKEIEASDERGGEERKELKYIGVRRRSWGKWVSEIREPKKKRRIWLGSYDNPHMAARAYDAAAICLKGDSAMLNFPHAVHTLPHPISSNSQDIQSAASQAARSFDEHKILLLSDPQSSDPPKEESDREICCESGNGDQAQEGDRMQSMGEVGGWEDLMVESPNMVLNMAEALLVTPPRMHEYDDEIESVEPVYSLWND